MGKKIYKKSCLIIIVIFFLVNINLSSYASKNDNKNINFKRITTEDGLSQITAQYIFQDSKGYIWIGTTDGLNKYNGNKFELFKYGEDKENSISGNYISVIKEDYDGNIWVGTSRGLNKINPNTNEIKIYMMDKDEGNLSYYDITDILIDSKGDIYVATGNGLNIYNKEKDSFQRIYISDDERYSLSDQCIYSIVQDLYGDYWVGTENGLNKISQESKEVTKLYSNESENSISDNVIYKLYSDNSNFLWIGTYTGGLNKLNLETNEIEVFKENPRDDWSIGGNEINYILRDSKNELWIGTNNGLSKFNEKEEKFINYKSKIYDPQTLVDNSILSLCEDKSGTIWVGTYRGISLFNSQDVFNNYKNDPFDNNSLSENMVSGIYEDSEGLLWVGTMNKGINIIDKNNYINKFTALDNESSLKQNNIRDIVGINNEIWIATEYGLVKFDKSTEEITRYVNESSNNSLISNDVKSLYIDFEGVLWIGTKNGLCTFDRKEKFKSYNSVFVDNQIHENMISDINQDKDGLIWIALGLDGGLVSLNKKTEEVKNYKNIKDDKKSISFNSIKSIAIDSNNDVWVGTHYGLNKFNRETEDFDRYTETEGLSNNFIYGVLVDDDDNVWMSTNYGLSKYDVKEDKFSRYYVTDGLQGNEFNEYSYFKSKSGEMFFGGTNGFTRFYPKEVKEKKFNPDVVIDSVYSRGKRILDLSNIYLNYKDNYIEFNFFMPDYGEVGKIQYAYKLDGIDKEWILTENMGYSNYTNLKSGEYTFKVAARGSSGNWSVPTVINFEIAKKPWQTPIAYGVYTIAIILIIYLIWNRVKILDNLVTQRTTELNRKLIENKKLYDMLIKTERYKNNYFVNLSHELRTPLNVITSTQQLINKLNEDKKKISKEKLTYYMNIIKRNSDRLLKLIDNIIDTSKIESGSYKLDIREHDIVFLVEEIALSMKDYIEGKGMELIIDTDVEEKKIDCDDIEIERCIVNLIDNAVKFSGKDSKIEVNIRDLDEKISISVRDSGIGIEERFHELIFDRFAQAYKNTTEEHGGSGLGLTLTKQLIKLHKGDIIVKSELGKGSEFIIVLPTNQNI